MNVLKISKFRHYIYYFTGFEYGKKSGDAIYEILPFLREYNEEYRRFMISAKK